jgi:hypothetical protein
MKDRYLDHLSQEENETLDIIADIIAGYVIRKHEDNQNKAEMPYSELNNIPLIPNQLYVAKIWTTKKRLKLKRFQFRTREGIAASQRVPFVSSSK